MVDLKAWYVHEEYDKYDDIRGVIQLSSGGMEKKASLTTFWIVHSNKYKELLEYALEKTKPGCKFCVMNGDEVLIPLQVQDNEKKASKQAIEKLKLAEIKNSTLFSAEYWIKKLPADGIQIAILTDQNVNTKFPVVRAKCKSGVDDVHNIMASSLTLDIYSPHNEFTFYSAGQHTKVGRGHYTITLPTMACDQKTCISFDLDGYNYAINNRFSMPMLITLRYKDVYTNKEHSKFMVISPTISSVV